MITRSLLYGIPLIIPDSLSLKDIISAMNKFRPTLISFVAAQLKMIVDEEIIPNPELKNCLIGGGFYDQEVISKAYELGWPINIVYGSTETASFVTALLKDEILIKPNSAGRVVPTNKIYIKDEFGNEQRPFEIGEIVVQSNALMTGYTQRNETEKVLKDGFYFTGDLGFLDDDSYLYIDSRRNFMITTGGENVNPSEVEKEILNHPLVLEVAVFPLKDKKWGEIVAASIVLKDNLTKLTYDDLKNFLRGRISDFKITKKIFIEDQLPKTELGKVEKAKLIERYRLTSL